MFQCRWVKKCEHQLQLANKSLSSSLYQQHIHCSKDHIHYESQKMNKHTSFSNLSAVSCRTEATAAVCVPVCNKKTLVWQYLVKLKTYPHQLVTVKSYLNLVQLQINSVPLVLWHCWFGIRKSMRPVKIEWWGVGVVICLQQSADCLHMVKLIPLHPKIP